MKRIVSRGVTCWLSSWCRLQFWRMALATVALCGLNVMSVTAGTVTFFGSASVTYLTDDGCGETTSIPEFEPSDLSDGFTVSEVTIIYTSDSKGNDAASNNLVKVSYSVTRTITMTAGTYVTVIDADVLFGAGVDIQPNGMTFSTSVDGNLTSTASTTNLLPAGTSPFSGVNSKKFDTSDVLTKLVQSGSFLIKPMRAGQVFEFHLPVTSLIYPVPEPGSLVFFLIAGLTAAAMAWGIRRLKGAVA
ncbi:MAG: hypothetical protein JSS02_29700 [Planctomycetes bacterium]|nr:hypothetical protein [Planctomycetota bacterium]